MKRLFCLILPLVVVLFPLVSEAAMPAPRGEDPGGGPAPGLAGAPREVAVAQDPSRYRRSEERWTRGELRVGGGMEFPRGLGSAGYGRAELGVRMGDEHGLQLRAMPFSLEGWGGRRGGGGSIPVTVQIGYQVSALYAGIGGGVNALTFDQVDGLNSVGMLSPVAAASVGLALGPVSVLADVRVQYRWQLGNDNRVVPMAGLTLAFPMKD